LVVTSDNPRSEDRCDTYDAMVGCNAIPRAPSWSRTAASHPRALRERRPGDIVIVAAKATNLPVFEKPPDVSTTAPRPAWRCAIRITRRARPENGGGHS